MARPLRVQFAGARYHVIDRGNYRQPLFATSGAAHAFAKVLDEAALRYGWRLHAHALIPNHFHLALETPDPNLAEGMHWMLGTFASRFNRFRQEQGHLFQGRYQARPVEDDGHLVRLIDYIHLNPVRAGLVTVERLADFRWSSFRSFVRGPRPVWLTATTLLEHLGLADSVAGWSRYHAGLAELVADPLRLASGDELVTHGWAIGSPAWRAKLAADFLLLDDPGIAGKERRAAKEARWQSELRFALEEAGKAARDIAADPRGTAWKVAVAEHLRRQAGAPYRWIADVLNMGCASSVRVYVSKKINM